ncbi:hypothetical protein F511_02999 [Dorcoceras hygrometricum]|nr:hypothetical protein F511_02999 [Dorcoceras hygrometricum]
MNLLQPAAPKCFADEASKRRRAGLAAYPFHRIKSRSGGGGKRDEKINLPFFKHCVGWDDHDPGARALIIQFGSGLLQDVSGVEFQYLRRFHGGAEFFDAAVCVNYPDDVEGPTWKNAGYAASDGVFHCDPNWYSLSPFFSVKYRVARRMPRDNMASVVLFCKLFYSSYY